MKLLVLAFGVWLLGIILTEVVVMYQVYKHRRPQ